MTTQQLPVHPLFHSPGWLDNDSFACPTCRLMLVMPAPDPRVVSIECAAGHRMAIADRVEAWTRVIDAVAVEVVQAIDDLNGAGTDTEDTCAVVYEAAQSIIKRRTMGAPASL